MNNILLILKFITMKKLLLLFGIASVLLLGNINSATAGSWVVFIPDYTLNNPNPPESVI